MSEPSITSFENPDRHADASDIIRRHSTNPIDVRDAVLADLDLGFARQVLDLGCGFGFMAEALARRVAPQAQIIGIDACAANEAPFLARVAATGRTGRFVCRRIKAQLEGKIGWNGTPVDLDYVSLSGDMKLEASKGQFVKLDPGAAGKLLGLISLQGLPRRITLDFKDVFSEGFAFDSIAGRIDVKAGLMHTDRLQIDGPSARILMRGDVDLQNETQKLVVNIQPELGGTAALGVAIINPIAGAATLLAHKVLQNPLNQIFSFDYSITGKWDDPKVDKISTQRLGAQTASEGEKSDARP